MGKLRIANWAKFQHYRDRRPPWIKLHVEVLDEYDGAGEVKKFRGLPDTAKLTFFVLLPLASRYDAGIVPTDAPDWIAAQTGIDAASVNIAPLVACGYVEHLASKLLAECSKNAPPEREREGETEAEGETYTHTQRAREGASLVDQIRGARIEYSRLSETAIVAELAKCPASCRDKLPALVAEWVADEANGMKPLDRPLASLRKRIARLAEGGNGSGTAPMSAKAREQAAVHAGARG